MIKKLIKIADTLDELGKEDEAQLVDEMIKDLSSDEEIEIPMDEYEVLQEVMRSLQESLEVR